MITTVVTSTVSTITTMTTMQGFGMMLGLVAVIALVTFLCVKELAAAGDSSPRRSLAKFLDVGIVPLAIAFAMIVAMEIVKILT